MPSPNLTHIDPMLTNFSVLYQNPAYVARELLPVFPSQNLTGTYPVFGKKTQFSITDDILSPDGEAREIDFDISLNTFNVVYHAKKGAVTDLQRLSASQNGQQIIDLQREKTRFLKDQIQLAYEYRVMTLLTTSGTYASTVVTPTYKWGTPSTSTPLVDIMTAISSCIVRPNVGVISLPVWDVLRFHADVVKYSSYVGKVASTDLLAELLGLDKVFIAGGQFWNPSKSPTPGLDFIWGHNCVFAYVAPPGPDSIVFGATFSPTATDIVRNYRDEKRGGGADIIEDMWGYDFKVIASDCGALVTACL